MSNTINTDRASTIFGILFGEVSLSKDGVSYCIPIPRLEMLDERNKKIPPSYIQAAALNTVRDVFGHRGKEASLKRSKVLGAHVSIPTSTVERVVRLNISGSSHLFSQIENKPCIYAFNFKNEVKSSAQKISNTIYEFNRATSSTGVSWGIKPTGLISPKQELRKPMSAAQKLHSTFKDRSLIHYDKLNTKLSVSPMDKEQLKPLVAINYADSRWDKQAFGASFSLPKQHIR